MGVFLLATLAGCASPAADLSPAATTEPVDVEMAAASGSFLLATSAPAADAPCEGVGTTFGPAPLSGDWIAWTLPEGAFRLRGELTEEAAPNMEISWRVCAFEDGALVGEEAGLAPLSFEIPVGDAARIEVFVGAEGGTTLANAGAQVGWALSGVAQVIAPAGAA